MCLWEMSPKRTFAPGPAEFDHGFYVRMIKKQLFDCSFQHKLEQCASGHFRRLIDAQKFEQGRGDICQAAII